MAEVIFPFDWRGHHLQPSTHYLRETLGHTLGIIDNRERHPQEAKLLDDMTPLFERQEVAAGKTLECSGDAWKHVYVIEQGIARLYRQANGWQGLHPSFLPREGHGLAGIRAQPLRPQYPLPGGRGTLCGVVGAL